MIIKHVTLHQNWRHKRDKKRGTSETKRESQARYRPAGTLCVYVISLFAYTIKMTCRPCLDTYIHTYKQTINQYKQIVIIHKSIETYSYTYTWLQMVRPPQPTHRGGAGTLCVHVVSLCADTKTMTCRPCWDAYILTYQQTDRQTHRHTYINQYKHIVIPIHGCICVTYPPFGGGVGGNQGGLDHIYDVFWFATWSTKTVSAFVPSSKSTPVTLAKSWLWPA